MRRRTLTSLLFSLGTLGSVGAIAACEEPPPPPSHVVLFRAESAPGVPLRSVSIAVDGQRLGETDSAGEYLHVRRAPEGTQARVEVTCPNAHHLEGTLSPLTLRRSVTLDPQATAAGLPHAIIRYAFRCAPDRRNIVLVVQARGTGARGNLPIEVDGRELGRTDAAGSAHVALQVEPNQEINVLLATATIAPEIRPSNPSWSFRADPSLGYVVWPLPELEVPPPPTKAPRIRRGNRPPPSSGPTPTRQGVQIF